MKLKIYFTSSRGVAQSIAYAIADETGVSPERLNPAFMPDGVDLMFIGYDGSHPDEVVLDFISKLSPGRVRSAALFNTNSKLSNRALNDMCEALKARGIHVLPDTLLFQSHPFKKELQGFDKVATLDFVHAALRAATREGKHN